jgi:hypothetical protein
MSKFEPRNLKARLHELAEFIAAARPGRIRFDSEEQFLSMLSLAPTRETARYARRNNG